MPTYQYNHTHQTSSNPKAAAEFFIKHLGAKVIREFMLGGNKPAWDIDVCGLLLRISDGTDADDALKNKQAAKVVIRPQYGLHHLAFTVDNLAETIKGLKSSGVEFILDPTLVGSGSAYIKCPDDVLIEIMQAPKQS